METPANPVARIVSAVLALVWLALIPPLAILAVFSPMASDNDTSTGVYVFIYACLATPVLALVAAIGCVVGAAKGKIGITLKSSALPFIPAIIAITASALR